VGQRINASDREREVRIVFIGKAETHSFDAEPKAHGVTVERLLVGRRCDAIELVRVENGVVELVGAQTLADHFNEVSHVVSHHDLDRFREYRPGDDKVCLKILFLHLKSLSARFGNTVFDVLLRRIPHNPGQGHFFCLAISSRVS
jgi:hypothetical protein